MKQMLTFLILVITTTIYGQTKIGLYKWKEAVRIKPCSINGSSDPIPEITSMVGQKFRVLHIDSVAIIQILDYTKRGKSKTKKVIPETYFYKYNFKGDTSSYKRLSDDEVNSRIYGDNQAYFKVKEELIDQYATKESTNVSSLGAGVINFPFKYRPQKGKTDFSGAFNFGAGIGYTFKHKSWRQYTHSIISGYSISNIVLDSSNTNKNQGKLASTNNFTAFSFSLGYLIQHQKVQAGIFIGWDWLNKINQNEFDWRYQGKPWISIGFGFAIFSEQKEKEDSKTTTQP